MSFHLFLVREVKIYPENFNNTTLLSMVNYSNQPLHQILRLLLSWWISLYLCIFFPICIPRLSNHFSSCLLTLFFFLLILKFHTQVIQVFVFVCLLFISLMFPSWYIPALPKCVLHKPVYISHLLTYTYTDGPLTLFSLLGFCE